MKRTCCTVLVAICMMGLVSCTSAYHTVNTTTVEAITATSGTPQSHVINAAFGTPLVATVTTNGTPSSGVTVTFTAPATGASGTFADSHSNVTTAITNSSGLAIPATFTANGTVGSYAVTASISGAANPASFSLSNTAGAPAAIVAAGGGSQSAGINSAFAAPLTVVVTDASQNPVSNAIVVFTAPATGASGTFANTGTNTTTATTNPSGVATSAAFTANAISGPDLVVAAVAGASTPVTFDLTNLAGPPAVITATSGTPQSAAINTTFSAPLAATVLDSNLNPVSGVAVTFNAPGASASGTFANGMTTETDTTNASGVATSTAFSANATNGGPYTVMATFAGAGTPADFTLTNTLPFKTYVFYLSGADPTNSFYAQAGAVQIDTRGNVLGGEQDYNDPTGASAIPSGQYTITGGTLVAVNAAIGQWKLTLNANNNNSGVTVTEIFGVQFVNVSHALIIQFDGTETSSGSMDLQTLSAPSGSYAFTLTGVDPFFAAVGFGGVFTISGGTTIQSGSLDTNDAGTGLPPTTASPLTGTLSAPDPFGRGTITGAINYDSLLGSPAPVTLVYYVVGPEVLRIIDVDGPNTPNAVTADTAIGSAFGQGVNATSATSASLGRSVFGIMGNTLSQFAAAGMFSTTPSSGTFSGIADDDELTNGIQIPPATLISGIYTIAGNGYGSLTVSSASLGSIGLLGIYLTDPNLNLSDPNNSSNGFGGALAADMDNNAALAGGVGVVIPQTDTSKANFKDKYVFGGQDYNFLITPGEFDFVGAGTVTNTVTNISLSGTGLVSDPMLTLSETQPTNKGVNFSGVFLPDAGNPGHYTMSSANTPPNPFQVTIGGTTSDFDVAIYQASGGELFWLNEDPTTVFLGSLQQQGSLNGLPAARTAPSKLK